MKEFYNLLFQAFNEKISYISNENNDLRECFKILLREINKYMDFKKLLLQKLSKDAINQNSSQAKLSPQNSEKNNENLLQLDFKDSREHILNNFNEILNSFRFYLVYDLLKVDPNKEFDYDEMNKQLTNCKYDLKSLPYYKEIVDLMDNFDVNALKTLKGTLDTLNEETEKLDQIQQEGALEESNINNNIEDVLGDNKSIETLQEISKDFQDTLNYLDSKILSMKERTEKNKADFNALKSNYEKIGSNYN